MNHNHKLEADKRALLHVFPEKVWAVILGNFDVFSEDVQNLSNSSPFLRHLLVPSRILFHKVLPLLESRLDPKLPICINMPHNISPVGSVLAKCRRVCREWSQFVDKLADPDATHYNSCLVTTLATTWNSTEDSEAEFLCHFAPHHPPYFPRGPFVGSSVKIVYTDCNSDDTDEVCRLNFNPPSFPFEAVLQHYGHHICCCELTLRNTVAKKTWIAKVLRNLLSGMPNLQVLVLHVDACLKKFSSEEDARQFSKTLDNLVELPNIRRFNGTCLVGDILQKLLIKMPNLEHLNVGHGSNCPAAMPSNRAQPPILPQFLSPYLRHLGIDMWTKCLHVRVPQWEQSPRLPEFWPEDGGLHVAFRNLKGCSNLGIRSLELTIVPGIPAVWLEWRRHPFHFPEVTSLKLITRDNWPCIYFVLRVRDSLENPIVDVTAEQNISKWKQLSVSAELMEEERINFFEIMRIPIHV